MAGRGVEVLLGGVDRPDVAVLVGVGAHAVRRGRGEEHLVEAVRAATRVGAAAGRAAAGVGTSMTAGARLVCVGVPGIVAVGSRTGVGVIAGMRSEGWDCGG